MSQLSSDQPSRQYSRQYHDNSLKIKKKRKSLKRPDVLSDALPNIHKYAHCLPRKMAYIDLAQLNAIRFPPQRSVCKVYGKEHQVPRDQVFLKLNPQVQGEYKYANHQIPELPQPAEINALIQHMLDWISIEVPSARCDMVIINRYTSGQDSVGAHADDEPINDQSVPIVSVSFGAERDFIFRHKSTKERCLKYTLKHGEVLVMKPGCQERFTHEVPKRKAAGVRFNFTFRGLKL